MAVTHNLCVKVGEYQQDGQQKNRYQKIGSVFKHDDGGTSIKLDCVPVGVPSWDGWVSVFPRDQDGTNNNQGNVRHMNNNQRPQRAQQTQHAAPQHQQASSVAFDDDIPF